MSVQVVWVVRVNKRIGGNGMKLCIECKKRKATHWNDNLCEECLRELLVGLKPQLYESTKIVLDKQIQRLYNELNALLNVS